jgi:hypothetical protein
MIFRDTWKLILEGKKTQTRRPVKLGESLHPADRMTGHKSVDEQPSWVWDARRRMKWQVGRTYAVQTERTGKGIFRIKITKIRQEALQSISGEDAIAEGFSGEHEVYTVSLADLNIGMSVKQRKHQYAIDAFQAAWEKLYPYGISQWSKNPQVWCLTFEPVIEKQ